MNLDRHRTVFNGDWGAMFWAPAIWQPEGGPYSAGAIRAFVDRLASSGVDTFAINANTQVAWYPSRAVPTVLDGYRRGDRRWEAWMPGIPGRTNLAMIDRYLDLKEAGVDWLAEAMRACRNRGISPWISVRMNDMHGADDPRGNPINCPLFHDPGNRLSGRSPWPAARPEPYRQALSYERGEVRAYMLDMIRELLAGYDADGLELDFLRNPAVCEPGAVEPTIECITAWIAEIRKLALERSKAVGHPVALGMRVPAQLGMMRDIGLDVTGLAQGGVIDFLVPSNFMQTAWDLPLDQMRDELGPGVALFGAAEYILDGLAGRSLAPLAPGERSTCACPPALRGTAAGKLALGAHGIEVYNYFAGDEDNGDVRICTADTMVADYSAIGAISSLETLRGASKLYCVCSLLAPCSYQPFDLAEPLPAVLGPRWRRSFRLPMCAEPLDRGLTLTVQIVLEKGNGEPAAPGVSINGSSPSFDAVRTEKLLFPSAGMTHHEPRLSAFDYRFPMGFVREGWNEIVVYNQQESESVTLAGIEVAVS